MSEELRNRVLGEIASGLVALAVAYVSVKLWRVLPDDEDPVLEWYRRARGAIDEGRAAYHDAEVSLDAIHQVHERVREITKDAWTARRAEGPVGDPEIGGDDGN